MVIRSEGIRVISCDIEDIPDCIEIHLHHLAKINLVWLFVAVHLSMTLGAKGGLDVMLDRDWLNPDPIKDFMQCPHLENVRLLAANAPISAAWFQSILN